jgi:predicted Rdx family selenoprotein
MRSVAKIALGTALGIILAAVLLVVGGVVAIGASVSGASKTPRAAVPEPPSARADRDRTPRVAAARDSERSRSAQPLRPTPHQSRHGDALTACDANIRVKATTTSCAFAQNVFLAYWMDQDSPGAFAGESGLPAYSPAVDRMFTVNCSGDPVVCRTGDGGYVTFPMTAVEAYTTADAERYTAAHDTGGVGPSDTDASGASADEPGSDSDECDPNYAGECLDPNSPDYDCAGGTGDGPDYTGTIEVVGDDPYDLDRDGDGVACDA